MKRLLPLCFLIITHFIYAQAEIDYEYKNEMYSKSLTELKLIRNEFYAKAGYIFNNQELKEHFSQFSWYRGTKTIEEISLTADEEAKVNFIKEVENAKKLNKKRLEILNLLPEIPNASMAYWRWPKQERIAYVINCENVGYLINDNSGMMQKQFIDDNHLFVQVVDGSWQLFEIPIDNTKSLILTQDSAGDGQVINFHEYSHKNITPLDMKTVFPINWEQNFLPEGVHCDFDEFPLLLDFEIKDDLIVVSTWYEDECQLKKELTFKLNKEKVIYELFN